MKLVERLDEATKRDNHLRLYCLDPDLAVKRYHERERALEVLEGRYAINREAMRDLFDTLPERIAEIQLGFDRGREHVHREDYDGGYQRPPGSLYVTIGVIEDMQEYIRSGGCNR